MAYSLIGNTIKGGVAATSTGFDTTGANIIIVPISSLMGNTVSSVTDSKGNTYSLGVALTGGSLEHWFYYVLSPSVGASHTVTVTMAASSQCSFGVLAFSGAYTSGNPTDQYDSDNAAQPGSITPSEANELLIATASAHFGGADITAIDSSFTVLDHHSWNNYPAFSTAYQIQTTATARNPTWSSTFPGFNATSAIASFKAAAGGGGGSGKPWHYYAQMRRMAA